MVICLEQGTDHMAQLVPLPLMSLASVKSRLVLPLWYQLTRVVLEKGPLNGCMYVCMYVYYLNTMLPPEAIFQRWNAPHLFSTRDFALYTELWSRSLGFTV